MSTLSNLLDALTGGRVEVVDLTAPLQATTPVLALPGHLRQTEEFRLHEISRYDEGGPAWYWNNITTGQHTGTHFDAPVHLPIVAGSGSPARVLALVESGA